MSHQDAKVLFAMNLADYMSSRGVSRRDLCAAAGIPYTTLSNWLQAARFPRPEQLDKIAEYLNVSRADLLDEGEAAYEEEQKPISDDDLQFALWNGDEDMTEADLVAVRAYAKMLQNEKKHKDK